MFRICISTFLLFFITYLTYSQTTHVKKVIFQGFWWDYYNSNYPNGWANYLAELAPRLREMGVDAVWIPPCYKNQAPNWVGYGPMDHYDLGDKYQKGSPTTATGMGTKDELLRMIAVMHANGIEVIQDIVLNHVDGAGSSSGAGGQDSDSTYSLASNSGYKNFRYSSYATPAIDESQDDYWTRSGRWHKNYTNFHPNPNNNCSTGDICTAFFGPDIDYSASSVGQSSNIPTTGVPSGYPASRPYYNPTQANNYMYDNAKAWMIWFKKQTGVDGYRWDAVKHFDLFVQRELTRETKYLVGTFNGGAEMMNIGEWIGGLSEIDNYVINMAQPSQGFGYEEHTGTFDFSLRAYGSGGSMYDMVVNNFSGNYDLSNLPGLQQSKRFTDYMSPSVRVHRTVPFINSHDTYRPILDSVGNFSQPLGVSSGWNEGSELGGNGKHIDPREPRVAAGYAVNFAVDGNPIIFLEDAFDIGTTGKRFTHKPTNTTDLPNWNDVENISKCHQKLGFKDGDYKVRSAEPGAFFPTGSSKEDHLVIERSGKAVIGINDQFSTDQEIWIDSDFTPGTILMDYSGANGTITSVVQGDQRVFIKTIQVGHTTPNVFGHGYSVWAPVPNNTPFATVTDLLNHLDYNPTRSPMTLQEWEMADDLGDSHCQSLGQGGKTPDNSTNDRVVGKIFVDSATTVVLNVYPQNPGDSLTLEVYDLFGNLQKIISDSASMISDSLINDSIQWLTLKIRNTDTTTNGQKAWVQASYIAPKVVNTAAYPATNQISIWSSNGDSNDWNDCHNWEEGLVPSCTDTVLVPHLVDHMPAWDTCFAGTFFNRAGLSLRPKVILDGPYDVANGLMMDSLRSKNLIPTTTPYGGTDTVSASTLAITGNDAIVDWVKVEIRDKTNPATILQTRSALLQRDGDVVEPDGVSPVYFNGLPLGDYHVAIGHRNHLGVMTSSPLTFSETFQSIDFSTSTTFGTNAQKDLGGGKKGMWAGDGNNDGIIDYVGVSGDRMAMLAKVGSATPNNVLNAYDSADINMDGVVKYNGIDSDRVRILLNIGFSMASGQIVAQLP